MPGSITYERDELPRRVPAPAGGSRRVELETLTLIDEHGQSVVLRAPRCDLLELARLIARGEEAEEQAFAVTITAFRFATPRRPPAHEAKDARRRPRRSVPRDRRQ